VWHTTFCGENRGDAFCHIFNRERIQEAGKRSSSLILDNLNLKVFALSFYLRSLFFILGLIGKKRSIIKRQGELAKNMRYICHTTYELPETNTMNDIVSFNHIRMPIRIDISQIFSVRIQTLKNPNIGTVYDSANCLPSDNESHSAARFGPFFCRIFASLL